MYRILRPICWFFASFFYMAACMIIPWIFYFQGKITAISAMLIWVLALTLSHPAKKWLEKDRMTLRPYKPRKKRRRKEDAESVAVSPVWLARHKQRVHTADYPELAKRLPPALRSLVAKGIGHIADEGLLE